MTKVSLKHGNAKWFVCLGLLLGTLLLYEPVRLCEFVNYDDPDYVTENSRTKEGLTKAGIVDVFTEFGSKRTYWHPVTWLSHMFDCQVFGVDASKHHTMNLVFHCVNVLLLFLLLHQLTGGLWQSAAAAALFAWHPLQVDTVAWVSERKNLVSTFFWLLTLLAYVRYAKKPSISRYVLILIPFVVGLMAKPTLVVVPCLLLVLDFWPLKRVQGLKFKVAGQPSSNLKLQTSNFPKLLLEKVPLFIPVVFSSVLTIKMHKAMGLIHSGEELSFVERLTNAMAAYARYLGKIFWPSDLAVYYPWMPSPSWLVVIAAVLLAGISLFAIKRALTSPYLLVGWLWFLGTLVPTIGIIQAGQQAMADRFAYVAVIGIFIMLAWGFSEWLNGKPGSRNVVLIILAVGLVACSIVTRKQIGYWTNSITLFSHAVDVTTNNHIAHSNLGSALEVDGQTNAAAIHYREALQIDPEDEVAHGSYGALLGKQGQVDEALAHFREAARIKPDSPVTHHNLGLTLAKMGKIDEAIVELKETVRLDPNNERAYGTMGVELMKYNRPDEALPQFQQALKINPRSAEARVYIGNILTRQEKLEEAFPYLKEAVQLQPGLASAHAQLAYLFVLQKNHSEAVKEYQRAVAIDPNDQRSRKALDSLLQGSAPR